MMNLKVSVTTRQNGYSLAIDKEEFMYYTPAGLVEGIAIRLGMERLNTMNTREIKHLMDALGQRLITQAELRSGRRVL